jgi:hypothetical protein
MPEATEIILFAGRSKRSRIVEFAELSEIILVKRPVDADEHLILLERAAEDEFQSRSWPRKRRKPFATAEEEDTLCP